MSNKKNQATKEVDTTEANTKESEVKTTEKSISFDEYIAKAKATPTQVASFKYEAMKHEKGLQERTEDQWKKDFEAQANKIYK